MSRFDYVKYDEKAVADQTHFKAKFEAMEHDIETMLPNGRPKALVLTALEEAYMWIGKSIRDEQVLRGGGAPVQA